MTPAPAAWTPAPVLDPDEIAAHLAKHGVFDAVEEHYRKVAAGEDVGEMLTPDQVHAWLAERCAG